MSDTTPSVYIMSVVLFTFVILGGISLISMFRASDSTFVDDDKFSAFNHSFNVMDDLSTSVDNLEDNIVDADTDFGVFGVINALISSAWNSLKLMFGWFSFMDAVFLGLSTFFGVPLWVSKLLIMLVTIMFSFAIYSALFQRNL